MLSTAFILFIISQVTITVYSHENSSSRIINKLNFVTHEPLIIVQDSDFEVFLGSGTIDDPYIIEGYNFTNTGFYGVYIEGTTKFFIIRNCYFSLSYYGIVVNATSPSNTRIEQNVFWDCVAGIVNQESSLSIIEENECYDCTDGILILSSLYCEVKLNLVMNNYKGIEIIDSAQTNVLHNYAGNNEYGIYVVQSDFSTFENNTCEYSKFHGILIDNSYMCEVINNICSNNRMGIYSTSSSALNVENNTCFDNLEGIRVITSEARIFNNTSNSNAGGITLIGSDHEVFNNTICENIQGMMIEASTSEFYFNKFYQNDEYAITCLSVSEENSIHHNFFIDNNIDGESQAKDEGTANVWFEEDKEEGNYWSDIGDTHEYYINGTAESIDLYALNEKLEKTYSTPFYLSVLLPVLVLVYIRIRKSKIK